MRFPLISLTSRPGQHSVFSGDPTLSLALHPNRNAIFDGGCHEYDCVANADATGAFCKFCDASFKTNGSKLVPVSSVASLSNHGVNIPDGRIAANAFDVSSVPRVFHEQFSAGA